MFDQSEYMRKYRKINKDKIAKKQKEYMRKWKESDPEGYREYTRKRAKKYRTKLRGEVYKKLGNKCVECGIDDIRVLQIDHIHGQGRQERLRGGWIKMLRKIRDDPNIHEKYQLLCANHNWIKRWENKEYLKREE